MNNTNLTRFEILQACSANFLTAELPDNWFELTEQEQNEFLADCAWQPLEQFFPNEIWQLIETSADTFFQLLHKHNLTLLD